MYCTAADMTARYGKEEMIRITDKDGSVGDINDAVANLAISDASALIDGMLASQYTLPLAVVPSNFNGLCSDVARYYLYDDSLDKEHPAYVRYQTALKYLNAVAKGDIQLELPPEVANESSNNFAHVASAGSVFARGKSKGFV